MGHRLNAKTIGSATDVTFLAAKDLNNDGRDDIVIVHRETSQVEVWLSTPNDTVFTMAKYSVNFYPEKVLLADIDNDSTIDILCFGKLSSGISVLLGNKDGTFKEKTLILPEIPVVDASVVKLNDDDFPDIVIHNWLTNEMVFYYGMGELQFAEQNILSFGQDTVAVVFGDFNSDHILDYAIASSATKTLRFFAGDGMAIVLSISKPGLQPFDRRVGVGVNIVAHVQRYRSGRRQGGDIQYFFKSRRRDVLRRRCVRVHVGCPNDAHR